MPSRNLRRKIDASFACFLHCLPRRLLLSTRGHEVDGFRDHYLPVRSRVLLPDGQQNSTTLAVSSRLQMSCWFFNCNSLSCRHVSAQRAASRLHYLSCRIFLLQLRPSRRDGSDYLSSWQLLHRRNQDRQRSTLPAGLLAARNRADFLLYLSNGLLLRPTGTQHAHWPVLTRLLLPDLKHQRHSNDFLLGRSMHRRKLLPHRLSKRNTLRGRLLLHKHRQLSDDSGKLVPGRLCLLSGG